MVHAILAPVHPLRAERGQVRTREVTVAFGRWLPPLPGPVEPFWAVWRCS